jgi:hypothetical protein
MGARRIRREQVQFDQSLSRRENGERKRGERERRDKRMTELVKKGELPYTPAVLSWLSVKLDKPGRLITPEDVKSVVG